MTGAMMKFAVACAIAGFGIARAAPFDRPKPEVFARAEDQERARLLEKPCTKADIGHGCYQYNRFLWREAPCTYHIDARTIGSIPTDQCYKMEEPRRYRGVWIDAFEGQAFIPEGTTMPEWPQTDPRSPGWREAVDRVQAAAIWLDVERAKVPHNYSNGSRRMLIEFIGRKTLYPGRYGHMGMSGNEIIVDEVISLKPIE